MDLHLRGLVHAYSGGAPVLQGIDLDIASGELFFLLGGSGCGKTTLLRLVAGFLTPTAGSIRFGDDEVTSLPPERRDLGMVFQNYALWPHLTVAGNVAFPLEVRGVPAAERQRRVDEALDLVELAGYGQRGIGALSGGQQQRVALARAIVAKPRVLLLDEPLSNLDARLRGSMRATIRRVCKAAGVTAIYVTHDQGEALATADRIALLDAGRVAQVGSPRELYEKPATATVARFLGAANLLTPELARRFGGQGPSCLRPERIRLAAAGVPAVITEGTYEGDRALWQVNVDGQLLMIAEVAPPCRQPGDAVFLAVDPADVRTLAG